MPHLNLGTVQLPPSGLSHLADSEFVQHGAPLLVEYLAARMDRPEAEALVEQRVTRFYLQGGQLCRQRLQGLLDCLKTSSYQDNSPIVNTPMGFYSQKDSINA